MTKEEVKVTYPMECKRCGHTWNTVSKCWQVSCPSCGLKVENKKRKEESNDI